MKTEYFGDRLKITERCLMKNIIKSHLAIMVIIIASFFLTNCAKEATAQQMKDIAGCWVAKIEDDMGVNSFGFLIEFDEDHLYGEVHSYINKVKLEGMKFGGINYSPPQISIKTNPMANVVYEAEVSPGNNHMKGKLIYDNGTSREMTLTRYDIDKVKQEFPGIAYHMMKKASVYEEPKPLDDAITISNLAAEGIKDELLNDMRKKILGGEFGEVNSVLILKDNKLVFEEYFGGYWRDDLHVMQSVTKSIASLCMGITYDQVKIKSVDEKVISYFPEYSDLFTSGWEKISIKHLLTMSMGLDWGNGLDEEIQNNSNNFIKDVLSRPMKKSPGEKMEYVSPTMGLIAGIIKKATGIHADEFAQKNLFEPLGIKEIEWSWNRQEGGYPRMDGTLCLKPRDMAKIGLMILNKGIFNGKRVISKEWIEESTKFQIAVDEIFGYGYLWWLVNSKSVPDASVIFANGLGGEHIIIVPKLNLVAVTTGGNYDTSKMKLIMAMVDDYILKTFAQTK